ncbi:DUF2516 family protein [Tsukamurella sp. 8F]|uniref:DUF2516 family protein n=1 Tax=unclassified Tsukamurella TaxID=2633480 RepID=UPI0023B99750|nr:MULTISPECIES: DUF2516 family protein [unclassified Tsukamurella]MDF0528311.1 DUF2516 family protein [Tsukamurella sp. 8J]MDF0586136.1 DUF2516 family protein [Tsukamurella sp. 8F]
MSTFAYNLANIQNLIFLALQAVVLVVGVFALVHCARTREDAFRAVGKLEKKYWLLILVGAVLVDIALGVMGLVIGAIAVILYMVDVRPKVDEVQKRSRY